MKIYPVGAELFRTDTQRDMTKLTDAFGSFVNEPNKGPPIRLQVSRFWCFRNDVAKVEDDKSVSYWFPAIRGKLVDSYAIGRPFNMRLLFPIETSEMITR
jgi:hypothetical protein